MLRIRDLGINVIVPNDTGTCNVTCGESCDPSGQCVPSCEGASQAPRHRSGFTDGAAAQLRQQLREQLGR